MTKTYTDEQRAWVVQHPDYPGWLILENFCTKFGVKPTEQMKRWIYDTRLRARGTSNAKRSMGGNPAGAKRGKPALEHDVDFWLHNVEQS